MEKESKTTITIETEEIWIIKRQRFFTRSFCQECSRDVCLVQPQDAALLSFRDLDTIYSLMESKYFHLKYLNGKPLICLNSLCSI
jgi:hypothetical protein